MNSTISYSTLPKFSFFKPNSLNETLKLLNDHQDNAKILAGGTDLLIELQQRLKSPKVIIDIKNVPELRILRITDTELNIGATVSIMEILSLPAIQDQYLALYESLKDLADEVIRYRATVGGNIGNSSPAADSAAPLLVYESEIHVSSLKNGERVIPIKEFFTGVKTNSLQPNELITKISIPKPDENTLSSFRKMKRSAEDLAVVGVAGCRNNDHTLLSYIAIAPTPILVDITTRFPRNLETINDINFEQLWEYICPHLKPIDDVRASKAFRMHIAEVLTLTVLKEII
ncbi:MAG: FAD binding domain-containing protein [Candidatus Hodarchaeales archaeon]|jgi:CO/xanthine dehydrogenase FAD-binding subunit